MLVPILISLLLAQSVALVFLVWAVWPVISKEWQRITGPDDGEAALRAEDFLLVDAWLKACRAHHAAVLDTPTASRNEFLDQLAAARLGGSY